MRLIGAFEGRPGLVDLRSRYRSQLELVGTLGVEAEADMLNLF